MRRISRQVPCAEQCTSARKNKPQACQPVAGGRAKRHHRISGLECQTTPKGVAELWHPFREPKVRQPAAGRLRSAATSGHSAPTLRVGLSHPSKFVYACRQ